MRRGIAVILAIAPLLAGCFSWLPDLPSIGSGASRLTNAAVEACEKAAREKGFHSPSERQSNPAGEGRYTVVLDVRDRDGYTQATCAYDPASGAKIDKSPQT